MNHHTPGVIVFPGATGTVDFPGVNPRNYVVAFAGTIAGVQLWWSWPTSDALRIHAHNPTARPVTVIPLVKDDR